MSYNDCIIREKKMKRKQANLGPITFGLDIGIASVGWAVLGENRIIDLGVRCFDKAETAKEGESLNLARRTARLMRRRVSSTTPSPKVTMRRNSCRTASWPC